MLIRVISLKKSTQRQNYIDTQFKAIGVDFQFFDAIEGNEGVASFQRLNHEQFLINTGRSVGPGEVGCYASHMAVWRQCVARDQPCVVVEDDACLKPNFPAALACVERFIGACGFMRLQGDVRRRKGMTKVADWREFELYRYLSYPLGALCYAIAPPVASVFVDASRVFAAPVDVFIKQFWIHEQPLFRLSPNAVQESEYSRSSHIRSDRQLAKRSAAVRLRRFTAKAGGSLRRTIFNLRNRASTSPLIEG